MTDYKPICDTCKYTYGKCNINPEDITIKILQKGTLVFDRVVKCKLHSPMYKNNDQIENLVCPVCKDKKIILHELSEAWRAQCENHIWSCHVKTWYYQTKEGAIEAGKRLAKGIYVGLSQEEVFAGFSDGYTEYPDVKSLCESCKFKPADCEAHGDDVEFYQDWNIAIKCKFHKEEKNNEKPHD